MLNPASPLPLYHQLAELLGARIASGELATGAQLPSEPALSREHGIGRPTVRQAMDVLVQRGLVERRRGSGTYVREAPRKVDLFSLAGTLSSFRDGGVDLETTLLQRVGVRHVETDPENPFSDRDAYTFVRLGRIDAVPVLLESLYLEPALFPDLNRALVAGASLSRVVEERYYLRPTHAEQSFRAVLVPKDVREALRVGAREPVLLVKRTLHFPKAPAAIFTELYCRTGELVFSQTIGAETHHG